MFCENVFQRQGCNQHHQQSLLRFSSLSLSKRLRFRQGVVPFHFLTTRLIFFLTTRGRWQGFSRQRDGTTREYDLVRFFVKRNKRKVIAGLEVDWNFFCANESAGIGLFSLQRERTRKGNEDFILFFMLLREPKLHDNYFVLLFAQEIAHESKGFPRISLRDPRV